MRTSVVIVSRNDNYGGNLVERATYCLNSMIDTFDEVLYIDWNSPKKSLLNEIRPNLQFRGNLKHFIINPEVAAILTGDDPQAQVCCETLGRNIGIRRATGDWIVSSNIDIIAPVKYDLDNAISNLDKNTFYTISRRPIDLPIIKEYVSKLEENFNENRPDPLFLFNEYHHWIHTRQHLISISEERHYEEAVVKGDDYSIVNCCGDFQISHRNIWNTIRGFEEDLIYTLYSDTNVQKKAVMHGFGLKALYNPALFHINHGKGGGGFLDGINKKVNDMGRAVIFQHHTQNKDTWGFSDIEIEYESL